MPRKNRYQWEAAQAPQDQPVRKSRSQKKRESSALQELGAACRKLAMM